MGGKITSFNRVFLFRPDPEIYLGLHLLPAGLGILAEQMEIDSIEYDVFDMALGYKTSDLMERIEAFQPDLIGCSLISFMYKKSYDILDEVKGKFPDAKIVVGGPHVSMFREKVLTDCKAADYAIVQEGEESLIELIQGKSLDEIRGLHYRNGKTTFFTGKRELLRDLDKFSFPKYRKFEVEKYSDIIPIYSSRGCPYDCTFCGIKDVIGRPFRAMSNDLLIEQIQYWHDKGHRKISFSDDNFTFKPKRIFELCDLIKERNLTGIHYAVWDTRADSTSRELLVAMKDVGFRILLVGVESANNHILKIMKKGETIEEIDRMVKDATELGFEVRLSFLIGYPSETVADVERSFQFALKYPIKGASFFNIVPTPNTELLRYVQSEGYLHIEPEVYLNSTVNSQMVPLFGTPEISLEVRKQLLKKSEVVAHKIIQNYWLHHLNLKRFGFLSVLALNIFMNPYAYKYIMNNARIKKMLKTILGI